MAGRRNYLEGYTGVDMVRRAIAIAGGWGWCDEHKESFKHHDHGGVSSGILERDGFGPSVHDDSFKWED